MTDTRFLIIDPFAGISGDMLLGALVDLIGEHSWLSGLPARLQIPDASVHTERVDRCGISAVKATVAIHDHLVEGPGGVIQNAADHADGVGLSSQFDEVITDSASHVTHHHGHGSHRHVKELIRKIETAEIAAPVRDAAITVFQLLAQAEGRVHGVAPENVSLHEVGAWDALVDIVGVCEGMHRLGVAQIATRPVSLGSGWVHAAHGLLPVPAPASAILAEGLAIGPDGPVVGEASTPTGLALLRALVNSTVPPNWRPIAQGWGAGSRNPKGYPNAVRLFLGEDSTQAEEIMTVVSDIDDLSPEYIADLEQQLRDAGSLDVQSWTTIGKKGRHSIRVEALAPLGRDEPIANVFFQHSSTIGVRMTRAERRTLSREVVKVMCDDQPIRVKVSRTADKVKYKAEYDDVVAAGRNLGRPSWEIAREAVNRAERLAGKSASGNSDAYKES